MFKRLTVTAAIIAVGLVGGLDYSAVAQTSEPIRSESINLSNNSCGVGILPAFEGSYGEV